MGLLEEAFRLESLAMRAARRGEIDLAIEYLKKAASYLEELERKEQDTIKRAMWRKYRQRILQKISEIKKSPEKFVETVSVTKPEPVGVARERREIPTRPRIQKVRAPKKIPDVCRSGAFTLEYPDITFDDVAGFKELKRELREAIEWQIKYPHYLERLKIKPLKGLLLYGPPGTGKTYMVKAAAGEFKIPVILADPATIMSKYVGESEKIVKNIFECARALGRAIIFVDEVDKLLPLNPSGSDAPKRVEAQFLQEMDGFRSGEGFIVVFATNEPWNISPALIRPGRIDRIIYVPPPDKETRKELFKIYLRGVPLAEDVDFDKLAELTEPNEEGYYSASGIAQICNEAKKALLRKWTETGDESIKLTMQDLIEAIKKVPRSISHKMIEEYKNWGLQFASFR